VSASIRKPIDIDADAVALDRDDLLFVVQEGLSSIPIIICCDGP